MNADNGANPHSIPVTLSVLKEDLNIPLNS
jgi:hypothetical protein